MSMPASLMGFGVFRLLRRHLRFPFTPVENVLLQSVACGMGMMPLGSGFVGVVSQDNLATSQYYAAVTTVTDKCADRLKIPAMNYLLTPDEQGPITLSMWQLVVWSLGLCYFGVVFAVPL